MRRLFYADIVSSVAFVGAAFLSLFFFIDFVDALSDSASRGTHALYAAAASLLELPGHVYELAPIAVLIGTIYSLSRMAQASEYTILRTGGLGPVRALSLLAGLGAFFALLTLLIGDYVAPPAERQAEQMAVLSRGGTPQGTSGAWLKDRQSGPDGDRTYSINIERSDRAGRLQDVRIFEFDASGRLLRRIAARSAQVAADADWQLADVTITAWPVPAGAGAAAASAADGMVANAAAGAVASAAVAAGAAAPRVIEQALPTLQWHSNLSVGVVSSAVLPLETMSTLELSRYIDHLDSNEQAAQRYQIQFWKRALYPFACLVMMALALPFAYLHPRAGGTSLKVFGGIMLGIAFVLLNNLAGYLGLLRGWTPWLVAAAPSTLFLLLSLAAFGWLVRFR